MSQTGMNQWMKACVAVGLAMSSQMVSAQSSVQVYGIVDLGVEHLSGVANGDEEESLTRMTINNQQASRLGFRGTEDLGGGIKALFNLEAGFAPDTGVSLQGGRLFGRAATIGLSGAFGTVTVGRQKNAIFDLHTQFAPVGYTSYGAVSPDMSFFTQRADNSVKHAFKRGGLSTTLLYSFGRDAVAGGGTQSEVAGNSKIGRQVGGNVAYASGPFKVGLGYDRQNGTNAALAGETDTRTYLGARYALSATTVYAGFMRRKNEIAALDATTDLSWIGLRRQIAGKLGVGAWLVKTDFKDTPDEALLVGASLYYDLSKRTQAYLNLARSSNDGASRLGVSSSVKTTPGGAMSGIVAGLAHSF